MVKDKLKQFIFISFGAAPGALIRWKISNLLLCNILGSFLMGLIFGIFGTRKKINLILTIGFCGSLTTFSSWILNFSKLILDGLIVEGLIFILISYILGLFSIFIGFFLGRIISSLRLFQ